MKIIRQWINAPLYGKQLLTYFLKIIINAVQYMLYNRIQ